MDLNLELILPDGLFKVMEMQEVLYSPESDDALVLIMLHDMSQTNEGFVIRTYMLKRVKENLLVDAEIEVFPFQDQLSAVSFSKRLPSLIGIEMLIAINGYDFRMDNSEAFISL